MPTLSSPTNERHGTCIDLVMRIADKEADFVEITFEGTAFIWWPIFCVDSGFKSG